MCRFRGFIVCLCPCPLFFSFSSMWEWAPDCFGRRHSSSAPSFALRIQCALKLSFSATLSADFLPSLAPLLCTDFVGVYGLHSTSLPVVSLLVVVACVALLWPRLSFSLIFARLREVSETDRLGTASFSSSACSSHFLSLVL